MKKLFLSLLLTASFYTLLAQKTINDPNAEQRNVSGFHGVDVATGIKLVLTEGSAEEVAVSEYRSRIRKNSVCRPNLNSCEFSCVRTDAKKTQEASDADSVPRPNASFGAGDVSRFGCWLSAES